MSPITGTFNLKSPATRLSETSATRDEGTALVNRGRKYVMAIAATARPGRESIDVPLKLVNLV